MFFNDDYGFLIGGLYSDDDKNYLGVLQPTGINRRSSSALYWGAPGSATVFVDFGSESEYESLSEARAALTYSSYTISLSSVTQMVDYGEYKYGIYTDPENLDDVQLTKSI